MIETEVKFLTREQLESGLSEIEKSPKDSGKLELIVRRPKIGGREVLDEGFLDVAEGLRGDNWSRRKSWNTPDKSPHPEMQLNIMNSRAVALIAQTKDRWQLAGDQLYVDMDLSDENLPPGTRLRIGAATVEITAIPHNGCRKFTKRFGLDAMKFVNSPVGKRLHLRGVNAKVIEPGAIRVGDLLIKI